MHSKKVKGCLDARGRVKRKKGISYRPMEGGKEDRLVDSKVRLMDSSISLIRFSYIPSWVAVKAQVLCVSISSIGSTYQYL